LPERVSADLDHYEYCKQNGVTPDDIKNEEDSLELF